MKKLTVKTGLSRIRAKLFATLFAALVLFIVLITVFSTPVLFRTFSYQTYKRLSSVAEEVNFRSPTSVTYYFDLSEIASVNNASFELINADGTLSYSSDDGSAHSSSHFSSSSSSGSFYSELQPTASYHYAADFENFDILRKVASNTEYFVYSRELDTGETIHVYSEVADVEEIVDVSGKVYSTVSVLMIIILAVIFFLLVTRFTKPLVEMNAITKDMAKLNFGRKCGNYGKDEIGELGESINTLSNTLDSALMDLKEKNDQLEKDIELRLALDNARKSFINNVSHELKTPIAIISGYAEGLCEGISDDPKIIREYCQIINDESQKMNALVVELLELSKLESKSQPFTPDYFVLGEKVINLLNHLSLLFEQNGITVINNVPENLECYAQQDKIEIVLKNYITNAVSHCNGKKEIVIDYKDKGQLYEISVFNTGDHIADHDLPELWDSFYRADKAHGRKENRFGLGLSIVRSIMENHRCGCGVKNVDGGVIFTFEISKDSGYYEKNK